MGVFSRLFGGSARDDRSYVRKWAEERMREMRCSKNLSFSVENLFASMMWSLSRFADKSTRTITDSTSKGMMVDAGEHYSGDAALFEVGCYLHFRLGHWLRENRPEGGDEIMTALGLLFMKLFTTALNSNDIRGFFAQRCSLYAELARSGANAEEYHRHLLQLILRTRDNQTPRSYNVENERIVIVGFFEDMGVRIALAAWEHGMIPALIKAIEKICDIADTPDESIDVGAIGEAAEQGDMEAQAKLGVIYSRGEGVPQDDKEAAKWFRKAAEQGHQQSQAILGGMYNLGQGVQQDDEQAVKWYRKAAEQGYASAQCMLGTIYGDGQGVAQNNKEAVNWYKKAAEQGDANAQFHLGKMYCSGRGVSKDYRKGVKWLRKAAEQQHADAQYLMGVRYRLGQGVPQDNQEAARWYKKASDRGVPRAQWMLGKQYFKGEGLTQDYKEAVRWAKELMRKAKEGEPGAQLVLMGVGDPPISDFGKKAIVWLEEAAEHATEGHTEAEYFLGMFYDTVIGSGIPDVEEVTRWFKKAAKQGLAPAQHLYDLGMVHYCKDAKEAVRFFRRAAEQGFAPAQDSLQDFKPEFLSECAEETDPE